MTRPGVEVTREEFYELLWAAPLKALVEKFGADFSDLVGLAEKHRVPRPAKGYWTKRAAGAPSSRPPLPENPRSDANPVFIPCRKAEQDKRSAELAKYDALVGKIDLPKDFKRAHPLVIRWIEERQRCSRAISKTSRHSEIYFEHNETDIRRHRLLDAIIQFLEKSGGKIEADHDEKWIVVWLGAARISFRVRELLKEAWLPLSEKEITSPGNTGKTHRTMLNGSGIITVNISGTFERAETSWSDAPGNPIERHLRQIAATFLMARDQIIQRQQEEAAYRRRIAEQQAIRRAEAERRQREDNRWACLVDLSKRADEVESARRFLERLERCGLPDDYQAGDRTVAEWMAWAREQIRERDPLADGAGPAFDRLAAI